MKAQQTAPTTPAAPKVVNESATPSLAECEADSRNKGEKALAEAARTVGPSKAYSCENGGCEEEIT